MAANIQPNQSSPLHQSDPGAGQQCARAQMAWRPTARKAGQRVSQAATPPEFSPTDVAAKIATSSSQSHPNSAPCFLTTENLKGGYRVAALRRGCGCRIGGYKARG